MIEKLESSAGLRFATETNLKLGISWLFTIAISVVSFFVVKTPITVLCYHFR